MAICNHCAEAADSLSRKGSTKMTKRWLTGKTVTKAREKHGMCKGCDCQHKVDVQLAGKATAKAE